MKTALKNESLGSKCDLCNVSYNSVEQAEAHIKGSKHKQKAADGNYKKSTCIVYVCVCCVLLSMTSGYRSYR